MARRLSCGCCGLLRIASTDIISVAIVVLRDLAAGDSFALGSDLLTVTHAERDASGTAWRVLCQR